MKQFLFIAMTLIIASQALAEPSPFLPEVDRRFKQVEVIQQGSWRWDFAILGGASTGALTLVPRTNWKISIPAGASIVRAWVTDTTAPTSAVGSPAFTFACGSATFMSGGVFAGASVADGIQTGTATLMSDARSGVGSSNCKPTVTISTQPATAGRLQLFVQYFVP